MTTARKLHITDHENGLHPDMDRATYDALDRVNWSTLKEMGRSPAHYQHRLKTPREDSEAMRLGRCVHLAVLEPERFRAEVEVWEGGTRRGKEWDAFCEVNSGKEILRQVDYFRCLAIQRAVRGTEAAKLYLEGGPAELTVLWTHEVKPIGGLPGYRIDMKGRLDFRAQTALSDLKTCRDASPEAFGRAAYSMGYHRQAAVYADGYEAATGKRLPYVLLAVESEPPHAVQVYRIPDELLEMGRQEYRALLDRLHACRRDGAWPGYADGELALQLPRWAAQNDDEDAGDLDLLIGE